MAKQPQTKAEAIEQLWLTLAETRVVMLSVPQSGQHPQPMSHHADEDAGAIWFIASAKADLAHAVEKGGAGLMMLAAPNQDYQASLRGQMALGDDTVKIDEIWSVFAAAWFEKGRDDPNVRLLRFTPREAAVWAYITCWIYLRQPRLLSIRPEMADLIKTPVSN